VKIIPDTEPVRGSKKVGDRCPRALRSHTGQHVQIQSVLDTEERDENGVRDRNFSSVGLQTSLDSVGLINNTVQTAGGAVGC